MLDLPVPDNAPRYVLHDPRGHVESYFLKANSAGGNRALWIRHTLRIPPGRPEDAVAEVWAVAFHRGDDAFPVVIKATTPLRDASVRVGPFRFEHDAGVLEAGRARGELRARGHSISWSLEFGATGPTHYPYGHASMYTGPLPRTKSLTPVPDTAVYGVVEVDGQRWVLSGWRGMQGHNWGPEHTGDYAWIHCNVFEDGRQGFIEGMSGKVQLGPVQSPYLSSMALHIDGRTHRFDGAQALLGSDVTVAPAHYRFRMRAPGASLHGVVLAKKKETAGLVYENPDGSRIHCLNSKIASAHFVLERDGHPPLELRSRAAALEIGTAKVDHGVKVYV